MSLRVDKDLWLKVLSSICSDWLIPCLLMVWAEKESLRERSIMKEKTNARSNTLSCISFRIEHSFFFSFICWEWTVVCFFLQALRGTTVSPFSWSKINSLTILSCHHFCFFSLVLGNSDRELSLNAFPFISLSPWDSLGWA